MPLFKYHVFQCRILCYLKVGQCFGKTAADTYLGGNTNIPNAFHLFMSVYISTSVIYMHFIYFFTFQIPYILPLLCINSFPTPYIIYHYKQEAFQLFILHHKDNYCFKMLLWILFLCIFLSPSLLLNINAKSVPSNLFLEMFHFWLLLYPI